MTIANLKSKVKEVEQQYHSYEITWTRMVEFELDSTDQRLHFGVCNQRLTGQVDTLSEPLFYRHEHTHVNTEDNHYCFWKKIPTTHVLCVSKGADIL